MAQPSGQGRPSAVLLRFVAGVLWQLRLRSSVALATYAIASAAQVLLVAFLLTLQGEAPQVPGIGVVGELAGQGRNVAVVVALIAIALLADFVAEMAVVRIQGGVGPVIFDRMHGALARHREVRALSSLMVVRRIVGRAALSGARLGLPMRFLVRAVLALSRTVMLVIAAVLVTDIPAAGIAVVFAGMAILILVLGTMQMWGLPPEVLAARREARRAVIRAMRSLRSEPSPEDPVSPADAARSDVARLSEAVAERFAVLARARLWVQVAIVVGVAVVGITSPVSGLTELVSEDPAGAAATILVIVLTIAAVAQTIRSALQFSRHLPTFLYLARIEEAFERHPTVERVRGRLEEIRAERMLRTGDDEEDES